MSVNINLVLETLGFSENVVNEYSNLLRDDGWDTGLHLITEDDLLQLGIQKRGHRRIILKWAEDYKLNPTNNTMQNKEFSNLVHRKMQTKHVKTRNKKLQVNVQTLTDPSIIPKSKLLKKFYCFLKNAISHLELDLYEPFINEMIHPVDRLSIDTNELLKNFENNRTLVGKNILIQLLNFSIKEIEGDMIQIQPHHSDSTYGSGEKIQVYYNNGSNRELNILFLYFEERWYICNALEIT
mmetsp:Transcript_8176/g.12126  ORF Transcript_8176/g.12126 Transcript_8176/m.12126 type:complete len:239 (+) Transcript_8176:103-819(+)